MTQPSKPQHTYPAACKPGHLLRCALTCLLCVLLALQPILAQAAPALAPSATLQAPEGEVLLLAKTDTDYAQKKRREADLLWWNERDQGRFKETVRPVEIEAGGGPRIHAGRGVEATFRARDCARAYQTSQQRAQDLPIGTHRHHWHRPYCGMINQTSVSCQSAQAKPKPKPKPKPR